MSEPFDPWVNDQNAALLTDLYELTMLQAYFVEGMREEAVFDLFIRDLPDCRNFLVACGLDDALRYLETMSFDDGAIEYLRRQEIFGDAFLDWLRDFRFSGDVFAIPEGTVAFANEPLVEVVGPIAEAQIAESFLMNQIQSQTVLASKAARVKLAAGDAKVVDFGMRRMHGTDAAMKAARAFHVAGVDATSNVLAGKTYDIPISGTVAHSYIEAHDDEMKAFRAFANTFPGTILLVDTYDTINGVRKVIELSAEMGEQFNVGGVRLDSGDLCELAKETRTMLDEAGLENVRIVASSSLDEYRIADLLGRGAPIDGFGVGSKMAVATDAPVLDSAYKLVEYAGQSRMKLSTDKSTLPGRKQVFRMVDGQSKRRDVIAIHDEKLGGRPLMRQVMRGGRRLDAGREDLETIRRRAAEEIASLPERLRSLDPADPPHEVEISDALRKRRDEVREQLEAEMATS